MDMGAEIGDLVAEGAHASDSPAMILTCPDCATRYFVEDERLGGQGRAVRCGSCGTRWTARAEAPLELTQTPEIGAFGERAPTPPAEPAPASADLSALPADELPKVFRGRAKTKEKVREAATSGVVWAAIAATFTFVIGMAIVLRQDVATLWPRTAGAYAMAGLPVNLVGLTIENQHAQPALKDGHAALVVSGSLRNIRDRPVTAPPLRVSMVDDQGHPLAVKIADPGGAQIPSGEARRFVVNVMDPPVDVAQVVITFDLSATHRAPSAHSTPAQALQPALRGSAKAPPAAVRGAGAPLGPAATVTPVPSSSPYALPQGAGANG